jgi:hypothetical protein
MFISKSLCFDIVVRLHQGILKCDFTHHWASEGIKHQAACEDIWIDSLLGCEALEA